MKIVGNEKCFSTFNIINKHLNTYSMYIYIYIYDLKTKWIFFTPLKLSNEHFKISNDILNGSLFN